MSEKEKLIHNINNYTWYPTKEYAESVKQYSTDTEVLEAVLNRINKNLISRHIVYHRKNNPVSRYKAEIRGDRLYITYCLSDYIGWTLWENVVEPSVLLYGSLWYDLEHHEKLGTPKLPVYNEICVSCGRAGECVCGGDEPVYER